METIHIFDEYKLCPLYLKDEDRCKKREKLEPLVFNILKAKYGKLLQDLYKTYTPPADGKEKGIVLIIERRIHENLQFILHNAATACPGWRVIIICSDINKEYCETIAEGKALVVPFFNGNPSRAEAIKEYNGLLRNPNFYITLPSENILTMEMDCYLRKEIPDSIFNYDYVGSPFSWDKENMGGGLIFRKRSVMIDLCKRYNPPNDMWAHDVYISNGIRQLNYRMPSFFEAITIFSESCVYEEPVGVHQWYTFFYPGIDRAEVFFHKLLTLQYIDDN